MRTQIALQPEQHARARLKAAELGISLAEYIRRLVDQDLAHPSTEADINSIIGLFGTADSDIAREKDSAIRAAISEQFERTKI